MMKKKKRRDDIFEKNVQGVSDRKELFRDASVYESNFAKSNNFALKYTIESMIGEIEDSKKEIQGKAKVKNDDGGFAWLSDNEHNELDAMFLKLRCIKEHQA